MSIADILDHARYPIDEDGVRRIVRQTNTVGVVVYRSSEFHPIGEELYPAWRSSRRIRGGIVTYSFGRKFDNQPDRSCRTIEFIATPPRLGGENQPSYGCQSDDYLR